MVKEYIYIGEQMHMMNSSGADVLFKCSPCAFKQFIIPLF